MALSLKFSCPVTDLLDALPGKRKSSDEESDSDEEPLDDEDQVEVKPLVLSLPVPCFVPHFMFAGILSVSHNRFNKNLVPLVLQGMIWRIHEAVEDRHDNIIGTFTHPSHSSSCGMDVLTMRRGKVPCFEV